MKKIIFVSHAFDLVSDEEKSLFELISRLHIKHYQCHIFLSAEGTFSEKLREQNIPYTIIPFLWSVGQNTPGSLTNTSASGAMINARTLIDYKTEIERIAPDAVVTNTIVVPWAIYVCKALGIPTLLYIHEWFQMEGLSDILSSPNEYIQRILSDSDWILFNSSYTEKRYTPYLKDEKYSVLLPVVGMNREDYDRAYHENKMGSGVSIITPGWFGPNKNQMELLEALNIAIKSGVSISRVLMVGYPSSVEYVQALEQYIQENTLGEIVEIRGYTEDILSVISEYNILVVPSKEETFGRIAIEGQLLGRIVIVNQASGMADLVEDGKTGLVYELGNAESLAEKIIWISDNHAAAVALGENARELWYTRIFEETSLDSFFSAVDGAIEKVTKCHRVLDYDPLYAVMSQNQTMRRSLLQLAGTSVFDHILNDAEQSRLYIDTGDGFALGEMIVLNREDHPNDQFSLVFDLSAYQNVVAIRFDPCEYACRCKIVQMVSDGTDIGFTAENARYSENEWDYFYHDDPQYKIKLGRDSQIKKIVCSGLLRRLSLKDRENYSSKMQLSYGKRIDQQKQTIDSQKQAIGSQRQTIGQLEFEIGRMTRSRSWRLTAPLRAGGKLARRIYLKLKRRKRLSETSTNAGYLSQITSIPSTGKNSGEYVEKTGHPIVLTPEDIKHIAFYLPQFHPFPENDEWWGRGFTEWTNVTKAVPLFSGHYQPRLAGDLGYYDLRLKENIRSQIEMARFYGIFGFCIYYYWFDGKTLMETPLKLIKDNPELKIPFCLCWANENWSRKWDGDSSDVLIQQTYGENYAVNLIKDVSEYMRDDRYIKIDGKPLFIVYHATLIPDASTAIKIWREYCFELGIGEIHILAVEWNLTNSVKAAGFDGFIEFPPHSVHQNTIVSATLSKDFVNKDYKGRVFDYQKIVENKDYLTVPDVKTYKGIFLAWDNSARSMVGSIFDNYSPSSFGDWLMDLSIYTKEHFTENDRFVFINAWNEWAEGTYLEPDRRYGYAALDQLRNVLLQVRDIPDRRIIYVSHDAAQAGAQLLSLNIIRILRDIYKYRVYIVLRSPGCLDAQFRELASELICFETDIVLDEQFAAWIRHTGAHKAICNTAISGDIVELLSRNGVNCISLIHEMKEVIKQYSSEQSFASICKYADKIVFASEYVSDSVDKIITIPKDKIKIIPQGLYMINPYLSQKDKIRSEVRKEYNLLPNAKIVLCAGYGYPRKGIDLFAKCAVEVCKAYEQVWFVWVGDIVPECKKEIDQIVARHLAENRMIYTGWRTDVMLYYMSADIYLLTSREDPFPSVVLEAMNAYLPVVAFDGGGGYVEIVSEDTGALVPMEDVGAMAEEVLSLLNDDEKRKEMGVLAHKTVQNRYNFLSYVESLLSLLGEDYKKISVVIPNYNYAAHLKERIDSILCQTYPVFEIIILDDASTDDSRGIISEYQLKYPHQIKAIFNDENSGSVFKQWAKGFSIATGDYVWIAEADDLSETTFLETLVTQMTSDDEIVMGYTQSKMIDTNGSVTADNFFVYTNDVDPEIWKEDYVSFGHDEIEKRLSVKNTIPNVSAVLFKNGDYSELLDAAMLYKVAGDWRFYIDVLRKGGKVFYSSKALNSQRRHASSVTQDIDKEKHYMEVVDMQEYVFKITSNQNYLKKAKEYRILLRELLGI